MEEGEGGKRKYPGDAQLLDFLAIWDQRTGLTRHNPDIPFS